MRNENMTVMRHQKPHRLRDTPVAYLCSTSITAYGKNIDKQNIDNINLSRLLLEWEQSHLLIGNSRPD